MMHLDSKLEGFSKMFTICANIKIPNTMFNFKSLNCQKSRKLQPNGNQQSFTGNRSIDVSFPFSATAPTCLNELLNNGCSVLNLQKSDISLQNPWNPLKRAYLFELILVLILGEDREIL